jgi:hypothetical protein
MNRSRSFATDARKSLESRHKNTQEVKQILSGHGFHANVPFYQSNPDISKAEIHQQATHEVDPAFYNRTYGRA